MSAIINGDSPSVTFSDGTTQSTSAIVSGKVPYTNLPAGSVLQVVNNTYQNGTSGYASASSSTLISTGFSVSITPKSSSSKMIITLSAPYETSGSSVCGGITIYRNSTNLATGTSPSGYIFRSSGGYLDTSGTIQFYDSPATTSSTTYTVYINATSGTFYLGTGGGGINSYIMSLTAMEIAG